MSIREHERRSIEFFGEPFSEVHLWLDEFSLFVINHRPYRHNLRGVEFVRGKWGDKAALAAEQHIKDDGEFEIVGGERLLYK